jgi:hypothetical protein
MNINFKNPESKEINVVVNVGNGLVVEAGRKVALYLGSEKLHCRRSHRSRRRHRGPPRPPLRHPRNRPSSSIIGRVSSVGAAEGERLSHRILRS